MRPRIFFATLAGLIVSPALADTLDFSFLVHQEIAAFQCPDYEVENPFDIQPAIVAEGSKLGWNEAQTRAEMDSRRYYQIQKLAADPDGYCAKVEELKEANLYRL